MLEIGSVLDGKYKILSEIGHGGMSVVYMALNEKANKTWAVKEIRKDGKMDFNVVRQGLVAEIETLKKLKHPNLPSIVDVIEDEDSFIIVMDYIEGNSLDKALAEHGAQPQEFVFEWAMQLCDVLRYLHSCDPPIIYRDMKPANIMLKPDGNIALIDFGTAKTYEIDLGETTGIGTIGYAAPEQYIGSGLGRTDARTDIYCLGITLYHLLTGIDPCKNVISDRSIRAVNAAHSPGLDKIILKCTEPNPDDRYQSCEELLYALEHHNEMGDAYKKQQKKKLNRFIISLTSTFFFAIISIFGYVSAEKADSRNYDTFLKQAEFTNLSLEERCEYLKKAIIISPDKTEAYLELIALLESDKSFGEYGEITTEEIKYLQQLRAGYNDKDIFGNENVLKPLEKLKANNVEGCVEVCEEIGFALWYGYKDNGYEKSLDWFPKDAEEGSLVKIFVEIGEAKKNFRKLKALGNNKNELEIGTQKRESSKNLWEKIKNLQESARNDKNDDATKLLMLREVVNCIWSETQIFLELKSATKDDVISTLNVSKEEVLEIQGRDNNKSFDFVINKLLAEIEEAKVRTETVSGSSEEAV